MSTLTPAYRLVTGFRKSRDCIAFQCVVVGARAVPVSPAVTSSSSVINCVEAQGMMVGEPVKSSSSIQDCVEAQGSVEDRPGGSLVGKVVVRDSKHDSKHSDTPVDPQPELAFTAEAWKLLLGRVCQGEYDFDRLPPYGLPTPTVRHLPCAARLGQYVVMWCSAEPNEVLTYTEAEWRAFLTGVKAGEFDVDVLLPPDLLRSLVA